MRIDILTLFPEMFSGVFSQSIIKRAKEKGLVSIYFCNFREFTTDKHKVVDDYPFGGGVGMVLKPEPIFAAIQSLKKDESGKVILLCPQGKIFNQEKAKEFFKLKHLILICGHYEGVDERVREKLVDEEISIGDYILTGGEIAAMVIVDAVVRLIPDVLEKEEAKIYESFAEGLLDYPQYTRPQDFCGLKVPEILLSGNHQKVKKWRRFQSLKRTFLRRPDLLFEANLNDEEKEMLKKIKEGLDYELT